ncbi:unnamed protein product, partial [Cylicostephanus goldi]
MDHSWIATNGRLEGRKMKSTPLFQYRKKTENHIKLLAGQNLHIKHIHLQLKQLLKRIYSSC